MKGIIIDIIIFVLIFVGIVFVIPKVLSLVFNTPLPMAAISSNSMWPVLEEGDLVFVKSIEPEDIKIGDVVIYTTEDGFIIHRVVKLRDKTLVTKGDANVNSDTPVEYDKVIGKTVNIGKNPFSIPYLGNITAFVNR